MNNKGMSIVEIIVSVALVSIVLIFMINLLITVKSSSDTSQNKSDALINRALIVKEIEKDFVDYELNGVYSCNTNSITGGVRAILPSTAQNIYCLRFTFNNITDSGYLIQYVDNNKDQVGIQIHSGLYHVVRRIFEKYGYTVEKLDRVYFAGLTKKDLPRGHWRYLTQKEVAILKRGAYA